jgi:hypothetical protein
MALGLGQIPGITGTAGLGDAMETEEERRKRLGMVAQQRSALTQNASPASASLFGGGISGIGGVGCSFQFGRTPIGRPWAALYCCSFAIG